MKIFSQKELSFCIKLFLILFLSPFSLLAQNNKVNSNAAKANSFINSLHDEQKKKVWYAFTEMNRYEWHYVPASMMVRRGIAVKDLDSTQKEKLNYLLQAFLSKEGYDKTKSIMSLEYVLRELEPNNEHRIPENYLVAMYGTPATDSVWGWKFSGHHIALNFTVVKDKIAFAPFFFGANPAMVKEGSRKGFRAIREEEDLGFELLNMLTPEQKLKAIFQLEAFTDIVTTMSAEIGPLKPLGIFAGDMTLEQKNVLNKLIVAYLSSMPPAIANTRMKKITTEDMNSIRFGWAGGTITGTPHYYRVQGKTFLIEFDNTQNNANHIHTVWRDFNGDYGLDLLREHYQNASHHHH